MYEELIQKLRRSPLVLQIDLCAADAIESLEAKYRALHNEHCYLCGKYKTAHLGACDGCRWKEDNNG